MKRVWLSQWFTYCSLVLPTVSIASCQSDNSEVTHSSSSAEHHAPWDQQHSGVVTVHSRYELDQEILKHQNGNLIVMWGVEFCKYCHKMYQTLLQLLSMYPQHFRVIVFDFTPLSGQRSSDILRNGRYITATPYSEFYRNGHLLGNNTGAMSQQDILDLYNWAS